jgi:hypothetical protein
MRVTLPLATYPVVSPAFLPNLVLPAFSEPFRSHAHAPFDQFSVGSQLGAVIGIVPTVAPAARDAADREHEHASGFELMQPPRKHV